MSRVAVTFALLCALSSTLAFIFEDCGSEVAKLGDVVISSCNTAEEKCILNRGSETHVNVKFTPSKDISHLELRAFGVLVDVPVPFPLEKPDLCKDSDSGIKCPLKKDQEAEYKATFFIDKMVPSLSLDVMWQFVNEDDEKVICVKFPAKIK
ncbi:ecdysteroid-regulated 16 kDa protein-like [Odontomachus brunneus]|uniref:ecdysteroid-regulated 16 kDa protein-like n=1 Tax=Odontomachus brunneus TaxID=486640 RepID=UPI0013F1F0B7|nr:ecdysteroid-regulated 16 kDa protein-like [Odontomachus brunneus]